MPPFSASSQPTAKTGKEIPELSFLQTKMADAMMINVRSTSLVLAFFAGGLLLSGGNAFAQATSCQTDFQKVMAPRQALIARINGFAKKRPTADQACSTLGQLVAADRRLINWMTENKDWCQIGDEMITQAQASSGQAARSRGQACSAASQQRSQIAKARAAQARAAQQQQAGGGDRPAPVGSGVRLPQGAL
jgi:hypothetical protein